MSDSTPASSASHAPTGEFVTGPNTLTYLSLFSGIGGIDLGLDRAGMTCVGQVEIDPFCRRVLAKHWPEVPRHDDVRTAVEWWNAGEPCDYCPGARGFYLPNFGANHFETCARCRGRGRRPWPRPDVVAGGFPCQPVSEAGKGLAQDDEWWLWPAFERVIRHLRPRFVFVENVPGLLTRGFGDVLGDLASLRYDAEWSIVSACALGASHPRERVLVVAHDDQDDGATPWPLQAQAAPAGLPVDAGEPSGGSRRPATWGAEPGVGRVAHGVPDRVDRLSALGNAVVPQVAEYAGHLIRTRDASQEIAPREAVNHAH